MTRSSTTHVVEVDKGICEPAFVPLTRGQELRALSVGKKAAWRLDAPGVLDVHAFLYFDGSTLFVQSADESAPALVDGYSVGTVWKELQPPCSIELGGARLRFRALAQDTDASHAIPSSGGPPRVGSGAPPAGAPNAGASARSARPFAPGELASRDDESTRFAPLDMPSFRGAAEASMQAPGRPPTELAGVSSVRSNAPVSAPFGSVRPASVRGSPDAASPGSSAGPAPSSAPLPSAAPAGASVPAPLPPVEPSPPLSLADWYRTLGVSGRIVLFLAPACLIAATIIYVSDEARRSRERRPPTVSGEPRAPARSKLTPLPRPPPPASSERVPPRQ